MIPRPSGSKVVGGKVPQDRILAYLNRRPARPEHLEALLDLSADEVRQQLDALQRKGWIALSEAWLGADADPSSAITVVSLTSAGKEEAERRQAMSGHSDEPLIVTRDHLTEHLRRLGMTEEQIASHPYLRGTHFQFWPSISAWGPAPEQR